MPVTRIHIIHFAFLLIPVVIVFTGCDGPQRTRNYKIGFSQCTMDNVWREQMLKEMEREIFIIKDYDFTLAFKDADSDVLKQENDIRQLIKEKVDILIVSPHRTPPLQHIIDSVSGLGVPVILLDRHSKKLNENIYLVGADNYEIGSEAAREAAKLLPDGGHILCFTGTNGSRPATQRYFGFINILDKNPIYKINKIECDWTEKTAYGQMHKLIEQQVKYDLIFSHNDFMARGIIKALKESNSELPPIIGIDGLNAPGFGIDMVMDSLLAATLTYPTGGDAAIQTAFKILTKQKVQQIIVLNSVLVNNENVKTIKLQRNEFEQHIKKIDTQNQLLANQDKEIQILKERTRRISLILLFCIIGLLIIGYVLRKRLLLKKLHNDDVEYQYECPIPFLAHTNDDDRLFIESIKQLILDHSIKESLNVEFISDQLSISHSTFYRRIKHITGLKAVELINLIRLQHAEKLLKTTNHNIKEIAFQTGFNTSSYFTTAFKKMYGKSPQTYRNQTKKHNQ